MRIVDIYKVVSNNSSFFFEFKFFEEYNMRKNQTYNDYVTENNRIRKWWHGRCVLIIGISIIILIVFAVTLFLVLKPFILGLRIPETTTSRPSSATTICTTTTQHPGEL
jgi:hypothetical protein